MPLASSYTNNANPRVDAEAYVTLPSPGENVTIRNLHNGWAEIATANYAATPASTSTVTMDVDLTVATGTGDLYPGAPIKYTDSSGTFYAVATAVTSSLLTIAGAPLDTGDPLTVLAVGAPHKVVTHDFLVTSTYADSVNADLLVSDMVRPFFWHYPKTGYLVRALFRHSVDDTGAAQPKINLYNATQSNAILTTDSNNGIQISGTPTAAFNAAVDIDTSKYDFVYADQFEIGCTVVGTNSNAQNLFVQVTWVLE